MRVAPDTNLYRYVHNDPSNRTDPTGLIDWSWLPWSWGSSDDKWQSLQNQETQLIQQMNQILGTQYSSIGQFTTADRARLEQQLGIKIDWSAFPSVAVDELAPQTIGFPTPHKVSSTLLPPLRYRCYWRSL